MSEQLDQNIKNKPMQVSSIHKDDEQYNSEDSLHDIHTSCKDCVFAKYDNNTQVDCDAGMLQRYGSKNFKVIEVEDNEKEFYVIDEKICMLKRESTWANYDKKKTCSELAQQARKECKIKYQVLITNNHNDLPSLEKTILSLSNQTIKPSHITIIHPDAIPINRLDLCTILQATGIPWNVKNVLTTDTNPIYWMTILLQKCSFPFIGIFNAGIDVPLNTFEDIDNYINDDLQYFLALTPNDSEQGFVIPYTVYSHFNEKDRTRTFLEFLNDNLCQTTPICKVVHNFPK